MFCRSFYVPASLFVGVCVCVVCRILLVIIRLIVFSFTCCLPFSSFSLFFTCRVVYARRRVHLLFILLFCFFGVESRKCFYKHGHWQCKSYIACLAHVCFITMVSSPRCRLQFHLAVPSRNSAAPASTAWVANGPSHCFWWAWKPSSAEAPRTTPPTLP